MRMLVVAAAQNSGLGDGMADLLQAEEDKLRERKVESLTPPPPNRPTHGPGSGGSGRKVYRPRKNKFVHHDGIR